MRRDVKTERGRVCRVLERYSRREAAIGHINGRALAIERLAQTGGLPSDMQLLRELLQPWLPSQQPPRYLVRVSGEGEPVQSMEGEEA